MKQVYIYKGDRPSEGAQNLRNALVDAGVRCLMLKARGSAYTGGHDKVFLNWGDSSTEGSRLYGKGAEFNMNNPVRVAMAVNKKICLTKLALDNVSIVPYFNAFNEAMDYLQNAKGRIYARTKLTGSSGEGIALIMRQDDPQNNRGARQGVDYPLYMLQPNGNIMKGSGDLPTNEEVIALTRCTLFTVGHIGARVEWRAHVFNGEVILLQKKLRRAGGDGPETANPNTLVRNLDSGWVYSVNYQVGEADPIDAIKNTAINAVRTMGLNFGAVDIIVDNKTLTPRVLEINTAPGLEAQGSALQAYTNAVLQLARG